MATRRRNYFEKYGVDNDAHRNPTVKRFYDIVKTATNPAHLRAKLPSHDDSINEAYVLYYVPMFLIAVKELRTRANLKVVLDFLNSVADWGDNNGRKQLNALYKHVIGTRWPEAKPEVLKGLVNKLGGAETRFRPTTRRPRSRTPAAGARARSRSRSRSRPATRRPRSRTPAVGARSHSRSRSVHRAEPAGGCVRQTLKKYVERGAPPYPANAPQCRNTKKIGNDGSCWKSMGNVNGVYTWRLTKEQC